MKNKGANKHMLLVNIFYLDFSGTYVFIIPTVLYFLFFVTLCEVV